MKKTIFIMAILSLIAISILSSCNNDLVLSPTSEKHFNQTTTITIDEARTDLINLLHDIRYSNKRAEIPSIPIIESEFSLKLNYSTRSGESSEAIHVFNFKGSSGFAIMSADNRIPSLIAYSENGSITEDSVINDPGIALFLSNMAKYYSDNTIGTGPVVIDPDMDYVEYGEWENTVYNDRGFCQVKWGQTQPYNNYCPLKDGELTATGCVATAVAQLMSIYKHPLSYNSFNFSWDDMTSNARASFCNSKGKDNIARLMQQLGLKSNLDMAYNTSANGGSGARVENIVRTLQSFGYSNTGELKDYSTDEVVEELKAGYPVLASGYSHKNETKILGFKVATIYEGGHCWLMHGLLERRRQVKTYYLNGELKYIRTETCMYPLCNWGWNGLHDGYYLSYVFDTTEGPQFDENSTSTRSDNNLNDDSDGKYQYKIKSITGIRK